MELGWWGMGIWAAIAALELGGVAWAGQPETGSDLALTREAATAGVAETASETGVETGDQPGAGWGEWVAPGLVPWQPGHGLGAGTLAALAQEPGNGAEGLELDPAIVEQSPVLRRWQQAIPDVAADIQQDPAFRPRLRLGYSHFPSNDGTGGLSLGAQDILLGQTPLALGLDYHRNGRGDRLSYGADLQYYLRPLGRYWNLAPIVGYRVLEAPGYRASGPQVGLRLVVIPSRTGAADLSLSQTWVLPSGSGSIGLTTLSVGYALTRRLRLSTDIQWQNAPSRQDSRVGILAEWML